MLPKEGLASSPVLDHRGLDSRVLVHGCEGTQIVDVGYADMTNKALIMQSLELAPHRHRVLVIVHWRVQ